VKTPIRFRRAEKGTSGVVSTTPATRVSLPLDFLGDASRRLGWVSLFYATAFLFAYFVPMVAFWGRERGLADTLTTPNSIVAYICIGLSVLIFGLSRSRRIDPRLLLNVGLVYEIVGAFGISMAEFWGVFPVWAQEDVERVFTGIPWGCVWIVVFPLIAPSTPRKTLLASLGAASTGLLAIRLSQAFGPTSPDISWPFLVRYFAFTTYLCAFLAIFTNRLIHSIGKSIQKAREVGSYQLVETLGAGGMGEVWRADHRMLARPAAVKLIRPEVLGGDETTRRDAIRRFEREAQATAALRSQHTIDLYDFGVTEEGAFYYVMELLDGSNLDALVKRFGPLPAARVVFLLRQACHSLAEAHAGGLVHRDIKPANIYVCRHGLDCDHVKVLDFGLVKTVGERRAGGTEMSLQGLVAGTPGFIAPELASGSKEAGASIDIYSLGCVAYWLLTGELVFEGETPMATVMHHIQTPPVPPSARTELPVPASLEKVVMSCLEKPPGSRPVSAGKLEKLLADCDSGEWNGEKAREWWEMHMPRRT
jgi:serine/threonine-protein kinase